MNTISIVRNVSAFCVLALATGCIAPADGSDGAEEDGPVGSASSEIINGSIATTFMQQRAVMVQSPGGTCTGSIIDNSHVLTAAHCLVQANLSTVSFYGSNSLPNGITAKVTQVQLVPGVFPFSGDFTDSNGNWADIAVLTLNSTIPATSVVAQLGIIYPGSDAFGFEVGRGRHDGLSNPSNQLRFALNGLYSDDNSVGFFYTNDERTNLGDSGGPIYVNGQIQGTLTGTRSVALATRDEYTAVSFHLPFILNAIDFTGSFSSLSSGVIRSGAAIESLATSNVRTCKLDCMQHSSCVAFSVRPAPVNLCTIYSSLGGTLSWPGASTGVR